MRCRVAGVFLFLCLAAPCFAQPTGEVLSVGFGNVYRPDAWTPMLVRVRPETSGTYQLQVVQEDLDRDRVVFTRTIALTGAEENTAIDQRFWTYFIPQPTDGGLLDSTRGGSLRELNEQLRVFLCDENGKQLAKLPITTTITNLEAPPASALATPRGTKLILAISDGSSVPAWQEYESAVGIMENVVMVTMRPEALPESVLGYEAVDAVVWLNAPAPDASVATQEKRARALEEYVRGGGKLVICQPPSRDQTLPFGDLMPVTVLGIEERETIGPLQKMAVPDSPRATPGPWERLTGPFRLARAQANEGAFVEDWIEWDTQGKERSPYLVRKPFGIGAVTWVAQDLGDPAITIRAKVGWPRVWDRVLGWRNSTIVRTNATPLDQITPYEGGPAIDMGHSLNGGMELKAKSRAFVGIVIVFFVAYWLVAGPGLYFYLLAKARPQLSWFLFAASAVAATLVTIVVVQLIVRGDPELQHVSFVRHAPGEPARVLSRFGLYIPRDGPQLISLEETSPGAASYLSAFALHPQHRDAAADEFPANLEYHIAVSDNPGDEPVRVAFPYRSTLKNLQAQWVGPSQGAVEGTPIIGTKTALGAGGILTNATGTRLNNVYFVYRDKTGLNDLILYLPAWDKGVSIDLEKEMPIGSGGIDSVPQGKPGQGRKLWGRMGDWQQYWYTKFQQVGFGIDTLDESDERVRRGFPMMSLFDRLPVPRAGNGVNRFELLRRGLRHFDLSHAVAAGQMVVLAEADGPLPMPLDVQGDRIGGQGTIYYQFVLPVERPAAQENETVKTESAPSTAPQPKT